MKQYIVTKVVYADDIPDAYKKEATGLIVHVGLNEPAYDE